jgi:hypothetical protein
MESQASELLAHIGCPASVTKNGPALQAQDKREGCFVALKWMALSYLRNEPTC